MSKNINKSENRTMEVVLQELNLSVDQYNLSTDATEKVDLSADQKDLVQEYNKLALLSAYAEVMKDEKPVVALAKMYYYNTVSIKDTVHEEVVGGVTKSKSTRSVADGVKKLNIIKFIEWTAEVNNCVAASRDYKSKTEAARVAVANEWKKFFAAKGDSHAMSIGKTKKALQAMFDALVFIPSETGKNAVIANGDVAKWVLGFANSRKDARVDGNVVITGEVLSKSTWSTLQMDILHKVVTNKEYEIIFEAEEDEDDKKPEDKSNTKKSKAKAKAEAPVAEAETETAAQ